MPPQIERTRAAPQGQQFRVVRNAAGSAAEIFLYGPIGSTWCDFGISADQVRKELAALGSVREIAVHINSEGGDVFDGKTIYSLLTSNPAKVVVHIDGLAASAASVIAMAGNEIRIAEGGFIMVHNAQVTAIGDAAEMERTARLLQRVDLSLIDLYAGRSRCAPAEVKAMMAAETWLTGREAVQKGFADALVSNLRVAASVADPTRFRNLPAALRPRRARAAAALAEIKRLVAA